ncbi:MAG TPA: hypothetical protein VGX96_21530 [Candidatus Elarobacter sp.]|nr:hypothetical protein [Candidatus Elarobacter sp.]
MERQPKLIVVAGPNGVGKSTYSRGSFVAGFLVLDPDRYGLAEGVQNPMIAGRLTVARVRNALSVRETLVLETTLSGNFPISVMERARQFGYDVILLYIGVDNPEECARRVRRRVARGGHDVPDVDIRRRYYRSINALSKAVGIADSVSMYDNAADQRYKLIAQSDFRTTLIVRTVPAWAQAAVSIVRERFEAAQLAARAFDPPDQDGL